MKLNHNEKILQILLIFLLLFGIVEMFVRPISIAIIAAVSF